MIFALDIYFTKALLQFYNYVLYFIIKTELCFMKRHVNKEDLEIISHLYCAMMLV